MGADTRRPAPATPALGGGAILARHLGNDAARFRDNIPVFASSDAQFDATGRRSRGLWRSASSCGCRAPRGRRSPDRSSAPSPAQQWFAVDPGRSQRVERAELAFFADGKRFAAPRAYRLQAMTPKGWRDLPARTDQTMANGMTHASRTAVETGAVRVLFDQPVGRATRLVEMKVF